MNILVTGAKGQLGSEIRALSELHSEHHFVFVSSEECDIRDSGAIKNQIEVNSIDAIINCAAYTAVDLAEDNPKEAFDVNALAVRNLATLAEKYDLRLVHISTDYVFDGKFTSPIHADEKKNPLGVYGNSKAEGEDYILDSTSDSIIIRTSWVYSAFGKNFVKTMLRLMTERDEISVVGDQLGSPTYANDLAHACIQIITQKKPISSRSRIYHFSNSGIISWYEFAQAIAEISSSPVTIHKVKTEDYPTRAVRPSYSALSTDGIQRDFGIQIRDWRSALDTCLERIKSA